MQARMSNPAMIVPDAMAALQALGKTLATSAENGGPGRWPAPGLTKCPTGAGEHSAWLIKM